MTGKRIAIGVALAGLICAAQLGLSPAQGLSGVTLTINPAGNGTVQLATDSFDDSDGLPSYTMTVVDVSSGGGVSVSYGSTTTIYSTSGDYDVYDTNYTNYTEQALVPGHVYETYLRIDTVGYTDCSIYYSDGCHWTKATSEPYRWRFTYTGASVTGTPFTAPSVINLGRKRTARTHGWKITGVLTIEGAPVRNALVKGQLKVGGGGWRGEATFRTDSKGQVHAVFNGEARPTRYRFHYSGASTVAGSYSKPFVITHRR